MGEKNKYQASKNGACIPDVNRTWSLDNENRQLSKAQTQELNLGGEHTSDSDYCLVLRTKKFIDFWSCHQDNRIEYGKYELFESELKFPQSLKDANPKFDSPIISEMIAFTEYMIIQIESEHEELPYLKGILLDWVIAFSVEFALDPNTFRYIFTGEGFLIYLPTASFGMIPYSNLSQLFTRFIELILLNSSLSKYVVPRYPSDILFTRAPNSWNPESESYLVEISHDEMGKLDIGDLFKLSAEPRIQIKRRKGPSKTSRELTLLWLGLVQDLRQPNPLMVKSVLERTVSNGDQTELYVRDMISAGYSIEETELELDRWVKAKCPKLSGLHWIRALVRAKNSDRITHTNISLWLSIHNMVKDLGLNPQEVKGLVIILARTANGSQVQRGIITSKGQLVITLAELANEGEIRRSQARTLVEKLKQKGLIRTERLENNNGQLVTWTQDMVRSLCL